MTDNYSENISTAFDLFLEGAISEHELNEVLYEGKILDTTKRVGNRAWISLKNNYENIKDAWKETIAKAKSKDPKDKAQALGNAAGAVVAIPAMIVKGTLLVGFADYAVSAIALAITKPLEQVKLPGNPFPTFNKLVFGPLLLELQTMSQNTARTYEKEAKDLGKKCRKLVEDYKAGKITTEKYSAELNAIQSSFDNLVKKIEESAKKNEAKLNADLAKKTKEYEANFKGDVEKVADKVASPYTKTRERDHERAQTAYTDAKGEADKTATDVEKAKALVKSAGIKKQIKDSLDKSKEDKK